MPLKAVSDAPRPNSSPRLATAARLLKKLVETGLATRDAIAAQIVVPAEAIDRYISGELEIPLDRQVAIATFIIERVPSMARAGKRLRGQVEAAIAYAAGETQTHSTDSRRTNYW